VVVTLPYKFSYMMMNEVSFDRDVDEDLYDPDENGILDYGSDDGNVDVEFENVGNRIGKAVLKKRETVMTAFHEFLVRIHHEPDELNDFSLVQLMDMKDLIGRFSDYLMKVRELSCAKSNQNYISCLKEMIIERQPNSNILHGHWYTRFRANIDKMYVDAAKENGTTLHKDSNYTNVNDFATLCRSLFVDNTPMSISMRSLLCFEWYCHGRINEVAEHLYSNKFGAYFGTGIRCMTGRFLRGKTYREDDILFMIHATDWLICPIHSFASLLACNNITLKLYPFIAERRGGDSVNQLLKRKCEEHDNLTSRLTSKCFKTGAATALNEHPNSKETNIFLRLGHEMKNIQTSYNYVLKTTKTESQTARLMSGWNDPSYGGLCPWIESIPENERESFQYYATAVIGCQYMTPNLVLLTAVVLVMNYKAVLRQYPNSILIQKMDCHGVMRATLEAWSDFLQKEYIQLNSHYLPVNSIRDDSNVSTYDIKTFMEQTIRQQGDTRVQINERFMLYDQRMQQIVQQNELMLQLLRQSTTSNNATHSSSSQRNSQQRSTLITGHFNATNSVNSNTFVVSTRFPPELLSRKSLPVSDFFLRWFKQELYNIVCQSDEESRSLNLFKNAMRLFKRFLPDNSLIDKRPSNGHTALRAWLLNLGDLSVAVEERALAFCEHHKRPIVNQVRQRKLRPFFEGTYKRLNELSFYPNIQFPSPINVIDRCTPMI